MYCQNRIVHTVQEGDSLYRLARQYDTTVTELILGNPGVNPYNLQVGMRLTVCPGKDYEQMQPGKPELPHIPVVPNMPGLSPAPELPESPEQTQGEQENAIESLMRAMRLAWLDMIYWTRMYLMSVDADGNDGQEIEERVIQAADEITDVFANNIPVSATRQLRSLLTRHVELTAELIRTLKAGDMENYDALIKEWYGNINELAAFFRELNPYFGGREVRNMLLNYLDMTRESIEQQINGDYGASIDTFRDLKNQVLELADYLGRGLLAR